MGRRHPIRILELRFEWSYLKKIVPTANQHTAINTSSSCRLYVLTVYSVTGVDVSVIVQWRGEEGFSGVRGHKKKLYARTDGISLYIIRGQDVLGKCRKDGRSPTVYDRIHAYYVHAGALDAWHHHIYSNSYCISSSVHHNITRIITLRVEYTIWIIKQNALLGAGQVREGRSEIACGCIHT